MDLWNLLLNIGLFSGKSIFFGMVYIDVQGLSVFSLSIGVEDLGGKDVKRERML